MNTKAIIRKRSLDRLNECRTRQPAIRTVLAALLVLGMSMEGFAQSFQNLDFESALLVPMTGGYQGMVETRPAFPGWSVFWETNPPTFVLHDNMFLDSAGVSILDTNSPYGYQFLGRAFQGRFTALLEGGFSLTGYPYVRYAVSIAQTGLIPASAKTVLFDADRAGQFSSQHRRCNPIPSMPLRLMGITSSSDRIFPVSPAKLQEVRFTGKSMARLLASGHQHQLSG